ncbi:MAG: hydrogenase maturation nickel metallochaperone HypA [Deltaproteobacteria bacterium]|nr:hydrogenase maturation nickel metallochaperone HypA [Deltaproteobacteria bacterium]MBW1818330.1 hydrogenase maturation nickel metallochaperone HypA [Deltaproteobacteria bacterium]
MHEMSIAQSLIDILQEEMTRHNATVLKTVRLRIGELSAIVPDSLSFCFEIAIKDTNMEGARLNMDVIPLRGACRDCQNEFDIKDYAFECPQCQGTNIDTISGQDLSIVEMEVE